MRELRRDPTTGDLVVLAPDRAGRPRHLQSGRIERDDPSDCPFCPGHESETGDTLYSQSRGGGWSARAFPNRFPALGVEGKLDARARGPYERTNGLGAHEVVVETPRHDIPPWNEPGQLVDGLRAAQARLRDLWKDERLISATWFRNYGPEAGASLSHPHAQIMALPVLPPTVKRLTKRLHQHYKKTGRELFQDILDYEQEVGDRLIGEAHGTVALAPWAPRLAFETWLVPTAPQADFLAIDDTCLVALADVMGRTLRALDTLLERPAHNAVLYTRPRGDHKGFRWHVRIMPRMLGLAGFEVGTGAYLNNMPPEVAAAAMRPHWH